jgi:predicted metal-dependent phosphoesterase TrpH
MNVDLHTHASERSGCSGSTEEEMIRAAIGFGLDGLAFTDHARLVPKARLQELNRKFAPFRVFGGIEITVLEAEDILVYGVWDPVLERPGWQYPDLHSFARAHGGAVVVAHPLRYKDHVNLDLKQFKPDALEIHSINVGAGDEAKIRAIAAEAKCHVTCSSDAHWSGHTGMYHVRLQRAAESGEDLADLIRRGAFDCAGDAARIAEFNREVSKREETIRGMIAEGRDRAYYHDTTGEWEGHYDRVKMGKSYVI